MRQHTPVNDCLSDIRRAKHRMLGHNITAENQATILAELRDLTFHVERSTTRGQRLEDATVKEVVLAHLGALSTAIKNI